MTALLKWGRYLRVSSEEQALPGTASIPAQDADTLVLIAREGGVLVDTYKDDRRYRVGGRMVEPSGERADRPEWRRLLADLAAGRVNAVAAYHSSRLYRNYRPAIDFLDLVERHNVYVRLCGEGWDSRFAMLMAWRDREENKTRVQRMNMGKQAAARKGFSPTRHSLFYRTVRDADGKRVGCEFNDAYRDWFDEAARLFLAGLPYVQIAARLGRNPATGAAANPTVIGRMFENPWYRGLVDYGRGAEKAGGPRFLAPGRQPAAWDAATVAAIEEERARRQRVGYSQAHTFGAPGTSTALFAGLLRCGYCGRLMVVTYRSHTVGRKLAYYVCHSAWKARKGFISGPGLPHIPNSLSEGAALALVEHLARALTKGRIGAAVAHYAQPSPSKAAVPPVALAEQVAAHRAELAALPTSATYARLLLATELERLERALDAAQADYERRRDDRPAVDLSALRAAASDLLALMALGSLAEQDRAIVRPLLEAFGAFYIKDKALATPPEWA